ncbi:MAG: TPR repeat-containing protein YrrB [bacterium ADurb.Bin236]|nr:MAG: TPR repeat-containing protein YrrB [bacterium ADurb.Bin236]HOY64226.1 endonuclease NucS [bacterium]HPN95703.1 endonuclease NucS [bacterium]
MFDETRLTDLSESQMEYIVSRYPEKFIEKGVVLSDKQMYLSKEYRIDVLFEDKFGGKLIVELQKGTLDRDHILRAREYKDCLKKQCPSEHIEVMVIANAIREEHKKLLGELGISYREITISAFLSFIEEVDEEETVRSLAFDTPKSKEQQELFSEKNNSCDNTSSIYDRYFSAAIAWYKKGDYQQALTCYNKALEVDPGNTTALNNRGMTYHQLKTYEKAIADFSRAIDIDREFVDAYTNRGYVYLFMGHYDRSVSDLDRAIEINPRIKEAHYFRGCSHFYLCNYKEALRDFDKELILSPEDAYTFCKRGETKYIIGDMKSAIYDLVEAIKLDSTLQKAFHFLGWAKLKSGDTISAIGCFSRAIALKNDCAYSYQGRGCAYVKAKDHAKAIGDFNKAIAFAGNDPENYCKRGEAFSGIEKLDFALDDFSKAINIDKACKEAYAGRGMIFINKSKYSDAINDLTTAISLSSEDWELYLKRGIAYMKRGGPHTDKKTHRQSNMILGQKPSMCEKQEQSPLKTTLPVLGFRRSKTIQIEDEVQNKIFASESDLNWSDAYDFKSSIRDLESGNYSGAIAYLTKIIQSNKDFAQAYYKRGDAYAKIGKDYFANADYAIGAMLDPRYASLNYKDDEPFFELCDYRLAIMDFTKALELNQGNTEIHLNRGIAFRLMGSFNNAHDDFMKVVNRNPQCVDVYFQAGLAYFAMQEYKNAILNFSKAIELDEGHAEAYRNRGNALFRIKRHDKATQDFKTFLKLKPDDPNRGKIEQAIFELDKKCADQK